MHLNLDKFENMSEGELDSVKNTTAKTMHFGIVDDEEEKETDQSQHLENSKHYIGRKLNQSHVDEMITAASDLGSAVSS